MYLTVDKLGCAHDIALGLKVAEGRNLLGAQLPPNTETNEIDVAIVRHNRLYAIECKTIVKASEYVGVIYKIAFQRRLGGLNSRLGVVGLANVTHNLRNRAQNARIQLFGSGELEHLSQHLNTWLGG